MACGATDFDDDGFTADDFAAVPCGDGLALVAGDLSETTDFFDAAGLASAAFVDCLPAAGFAGVFLPAFDPGALLIVRVL